MRVCPTTQEAQEAQEAELPLCVMEEAVLGISHAPAPCSQAASEEHQGREAPVESAGSAEEGSQRGDAEPATRHSSARGRHEGDTATMGLASTETDDHAAGGVAEGTADTGVPTKAEEGTPPPCTHQAVHSGATQPGRVRATIATDATQEDSTRLSLSMPKWNAGAAVSSAIPPYRPGASRSLGVPRIVLAPLSDEESDSDDDEVCAMPCAPGGDVWLAPGFGAHP